LNIGITGHQEREGADWVWARRGLANYLAQQGNLIVGWSSLAAGADQLFAQEVLVVGGSLNAVIPLLDYTECFESKRDLLEYHRLLKMCAQVVQLENQDHQSAFFAASKLIVERCDLLIAIWDEEPSQGRGGTADVVRFALQMRRAVKIFNPIAKTINARIP
jgi:hypothetical protein